MRSRKERDMYGSLVDLDLEARMILMWGAYLVPFSFINQATSTPPLRLRACARIGAIFFFSAAILFFFFSIRFAMYPHVKTM